MKLLNPLPSSIEDLNGISKIISCIIIDNVCYIIKDDGLYYEDSNKSHRKICSPAIEVLANTTDDNSSNWGKILKWEDANNVVHKQAIPFLHDDGANIRKELANGGVTISTSPKARTLLNQYIQGVKVDRIARCVSQTGWQHGVYVTSNSTIGISDLGDQEIIFQNESCPQKILSQKGSLEDWTNKVAKYASGNSRITVAISAAFAAPLLRILGIEGGGIHFFGASSTGKSTALNLAASVWGDRGYKQTWRGTNNGLEATAQIYNDNVLPLDEIKECDNETIGETVYMLGNGKGKARATKNAEARKSKEWRILFISSGETRLVDIMEDTKKKIYSGQKIRLADIDADAGASMGIFENIHEFKTPSEMSEYLNKASESYYGTAGIEFLRQLTSNMESYKTIANKIIKDFEAMPEINNGDGLIKRVGKRFAAIAAAGELATQFGITGWEKEESIVAACQCFINWYENHNGQKHEEYELVEILTSFINTHGQSRFSDLDQECQKVANRVGYKALVDGYEHYYIFPDAMDKEIIKKTNLRKKKAIQILRKIGIIIGNNDTSQGPRNFKGETQRYYEIDSQALANYKLD